jgi:hypothetical protein
MGKSKLPESRLWRLGQFLDLIRSVIYRLFLAFLDFEADGASGPHEIELPSQSLRCPGKPIPDGLFIFTRFQIDRDPFSGFELAKIINKFLASLLALARTTLFISFH